MMILTYDTNLSTVLNPRLSSVIIVITAKEPGENNSYPKLATIYLLKNSYFYQSNCNIKY